MGSPASTSIWRRSTSRSTSDVVRREHERPPAATTERTTVTSGWRGRISAAGVEEFVDGLSLLDIRFEAPVAPAAGLVQFGSEVGLSAYDAEYVLLAHLSDLPPATGDARMRAAARAMGVAVLG